VPSKKQYIIQTEDGLAIRTGETLEQHGVASLIAQPVRFKLLLAENVIPAVSAPMSIPDNSPDVEEHIFEFSQSKRSWVPRRATSATRLRNNSQYLDSLSTRKLTRSNSGSSKLEEEVTEFAVSPVVTEMRAIVKGIVENSISRLDTHRSLQESLASLSNDQFQFIKNLIDEFARKPEEAPLPVETTVPVNLGPVYHKRFVELIFQLHFIISPSNFNLIPY
jgi:hypothetical protein